MVRQSSSPAPATAKYRPFLKKGADFLPPFPHPADLLKDLPKTVKATILSSSPIDRTLTISGGTVGSHLGSGIT